MTAEDFTGDELKLERICSSACIPRYLSEGWVLSTLMAFKRLASLLCHVTEKKKPAQDCTDTELDDIQDQKETLFQ